MYLNIYFKEKNMLNEFIQEYAQFINALKPIFWKVKGKIKDKRRAKDKYKRQYALFIYFQKTTTSIIFKKIAI